jgi:FkbM family methyltransferase
MARIAFHANVLNLRGTEVALYDYAHYNELSLGNDSLIVVPRRSNHHSKAVEKFRSRFPIAVYQDQSELDELLLRNKCELLYAIKYGLMDGVLARSVPTAVHAVFDMSEPHGTVYAAVSDFLSEKYGSQFPVVPHMIDLPGTSEDMRTELGIPPGALVFGRHGGFETFDIPFVKQVIAQIVAERSDIYFLFLFTQPFIQHPQVLFLPETADALEKVRFINTCDAMLHGREEGETFGIACGEFSIRGRPVITYRHSQYTQHLRILGDRALCYSNAEELKTLLISFRETAPRDWDAYSENYSPLPIIERFREVFLEPCNISRRSIPRQVVTANSRDGTFLVVKNDNLSQNLLQGKEWEPHISRLFEKLLRPGDCIVDAGASFGFHAIHSARVVGRQGRVYAFEPQRPVFELLTANCILNRCQQVRAFHTALSHQQGIVRLSAVDYGMEGVNLGDVHIGPVEGGGEIVRSAPLDSIPIRERIRLIKIDVQGAERFVLEGARKRIDTDRPFLLVEFEEHCLQRFGYNSQTLFELIRSLGYEIFFLDYHYPSDHLCVPVEQLQAFRAFMTPYLSPLTSSNTLNFNLENGVREKVMLPNSGLGEAEV